MKKRVVSFILCMVMFVGTMPTAFAIDANSDTQDVTVTDEERAVTVYSTEELIYGEDGIISRAEWLHNLTVIFNMSVEEDEFPDNYFSDLEASSTYYKDILLAVEFGVVNVEAGGAVRPDDPTTREFAAQTLNYCLGYQLAEGSDYSFSDSSSVQAKDDAQIAIDRKWFTLQDGKFSPDSNVTTAEVQTMIKDAQTAVSSTEIDESHENTFEFSEGVIVIPDSTPISIDEDEVVTISNCPATISVGDTFAVFPELNGLPRTFVAKSVEKNGNLTVITTKDVELDEAVSEMDAEGVIDVNGADFVPAEGVEVEYIEEPATSPEARVSGSKNITVKLNKDVTLGNGVTVGLNVTSSNMKLEYSTKSNYAYAALKGDVKISSTGKIDFLAASGSSKSVTLGYYNVAGVGSVALKVELNLQGKVVYTYSGYLAAGIEYQNSDFRLIRNFTQKSFTMTSEITGSVALKATGDLNLVMLKGNIYAMAGAKAKLLTESYASGTPQDCTTFSAWMFAEVGASATVLKKTFSKTETLMDWDNSPIRVLHHYEDKKEVATCTRGSKHFNGYYTKGYSRYYSSGWTDGMGGSGYDDNGEPYTIFTYELDDDDNATITGYKGNARALAIPETLDGYTVIKIGDGVFMDNTVLSSVVIPDSITAIGECAFANTGLTELTLPQELTSIGRWVLEKTTGVRRLTIPKKVTWSGHRDYFTSGALRGSYIEELTFETGATVITADIAAGATYLKKVNIPDTVTKIDGSAFSGCTSLTSITIPNSVTEIGGSVFANTGLTELTLPKKLTSLGVGVLAGTSGVKQLTIPKTVTWAGQVDYFTSGALRASYIEDLTFETGMTTIPQTVALDATYLKSVKIPDTVTKIDGSAFSGCSSLTNITIPDSVTEIGGSAFANTGLTKLTLPKNLTSLGVGVLAGTSGVKQLTIPKTVTWAGQVDFFTSGALRASYIEDLTFETGIATIPQTVALDATYLKSVKIPDTVTKIEGSAFSGCTSLTSIVIPESVTEIGNSVFSGCSSLTSIVIPDSVTSMGTKEFYGCTSLKTVTLPNIRKNIMSSMFENCTSLEEIVLPSTVTTIQDHAFKNCTKLKTVNWSDSLLYINSYAFENCDSLEKVSVPGTAVTLQEGAFYDCDALTDVNIPNSVTTFGNKMFYDCDALLNVELGTGITTIPTSAFEHCDVLKNMVVPYRVTSIGDSAFKDCVAFSSITIPRATETIASNAFSYPAKMTIYGIAGTYAETYANEKGITFVNDEHPATAVELSDKTLTMNKGDKKTLTMTVTPANFTDEVSWKSTDTSIVTIGDDGLVTAKDVGTATIKLIVGDVSASCKVTVLQPVTSISLNKTSLSMNALDTYQLEATASPSNANNREIAWTTSDADVASVDNNGLVTAKKKGEATITAKAVDGSGTTKTCKVTVTNTAYVAETVDQLESEHKYVNNCSDFWIYTIPGVEKLSVTFDERTDIEEDFDFLYLYDGNGEQVGKYTGTELAGQTVIVPGDTVRIQLVSDNAGNAWGFKVTNVSEAIDIIQIDKPTATGSYVYTGSEQTVQIPENDAYTITGNTATDAGNYTATVSLKDSKRYQWSDGTTDDVTIDWSIQKCIQPIGANISATQILTGSTAQISCLNPSENIVYASDNEEVASIDSNGIITANAEGQALITISRPESVNNYEALESVVVTVISAEIDLNQSLLDCSVEMKQTEFTYTGAEIQPDIAIYDGSYQLKENVDYAVIYGNNVNAGTGIAVISAVDGSGYTGMLSMLFTVVPADQQLVVNFPTEKMEVGQTAQIGVQSEAGDLSFASARTGVAVVNSNGVIYAVGSGTTEITVTAAATENYKKVSQSFTLTVEKPSNVCKNHVYDNGTETVAPTCTDTGVRTFVCTVCGATKTESIAALGHTPIKDVAVEATCTTAGKTEGSHCSVCGTILKAQQKIPALGHKMIKTAAREATCTAEGNKAYWTCSTCKKVFSDSTGKTETTVAKMTIAKKEHTYKTTITKAKPGTNGSIVEKCSVCGDAKSTTVYAPKTLTLSKTSYTYNGAVQTPTVTVKDSKGNVIASSNYTVSYASGRKNVGTYKVTVTFKSTSTKYSGSLSATYKITEKSISGLTGTLSATSYTYSGAVKKPTVTLKNGTTKLKSGTDYTVAYSNNKNVGKATVKLTGKGNYNGTKSLTFKINPKATTLKSVTAGSKSFTAKWTKLTTQTTGYQIQYSTSSKFTSAKTVSITSNKTTSKKITKLTAKKKYYIRIRTYKTVSGTKYYSGWSKAKTVTTKK